MNAPKYFSAMQTRLGTVIGGPLSAVYFIHSNYVGLEKSLEARRTLVVGIFLSAVFFLMAPFVPDEIPPFFYGLAIALLAGYLVESLQISVYEHLHTDRFQYKSWWRVIGVGVVFAIVSFALVVLIVIGLDGLGLIVDA